MSDLQGEIQAVRAEASTLRLTVTILGIEKEAVEEKLNEKERELEHTRIKLEEANKKLQDSTKTHKDNEKELEDRVKFLESDLEHGSKELVERIQYLEKKLTEKQEQLQVKNTALDARESELNKKEKELENKEKECKKVIDFFAAGNDVNGLVLDLQGRLKRQEKELEVKEHQIINLRVKLEIAEQEKIAIQQTLRNQPERGESFPPRPKPRQRASTLTRPSQSQSVPALPKKTLKKKASLPVLPSEPMIPPQPKSWSLQQPIKEDRIYDEAVVTYDEAIPPAPEYTKLPFSLNWDTKFNIGARKIVGGAAVYSQKTSTLYFSSILQEDILAFRANQEWIQLPAPPHKFFGLALVEDNITAIGGGVREKRSFIKGASAKGEQKPKFTNKLVSFVAGLDTGDGQWIELFPPMLTKRRNPSAVATTRTLIVAGGDDGKCLQAVEVMGLIDKQWHKAAILPQALSNPQMVLCEKTNRIYLMGDEYSTRKQVMYKCFLNELLTTREKAKEEEETVAYEQEPFYTPSPVMLKASKVWKELPNAPNSASSTLAIVKGHVLMAGGIGTSGDISNEIYHLDVSHNKWEQVAHMPTARQKALVGFNSATQKLVVVGGFTKMGTINTVDVAALT